MRRSRLDFRFALLGLLFLTALAGCQQSSRPADRSGSASSGPGRREQHLALSPEQELVLGRKVYRNILQQSTVLDPHSEANQRVNRVGERIIQAVSNRPLQHEINLKLKGYRFDWTFNTLEKREVNAFCLPGGFVAVYTGLLDLARNDDQLATVLSHEIAHALAHHASERLAEQGAMGLARRVADEDLDRLSTSEGDRLKFALSLGGRLQGLAHNRFQESEADHIGVFLMTFAGYDPAQAVAFWERMSENSQRHGGSPPEILSDHPSDDRRIQQLRAWAGNARAAKRAFDAGNIDPRAR